MKSENETRISRRFFLAGIGGSAAYALIEPGRASAQASPEPSPTPITDPSSSPWPSIIGISAGIILSSIATVAALTWAAKRGAERT